ncbi:unnamed protein product [marine sediment metagenome]|uniref:Uncharacterized protein n=1 Tax=marine sediment metagenome TaxID=412755 RepID=X0S8I8_9ZZZZ
MKKRNLSKATILKYNQVIDEWFINEFDSIKAYIKYFPKATDKTAIANFSEIKALPEMKKYIKAKYEKAAKVVNLTHAGILKELKNYIELDIRDTIGLTKEEIKQLPVEIGRSITKHKERTKKHFSSKGKLLYTEETIELHFISKERILDMINKHIGFYAVDNQQKTPEIQIHTKNEQHLKIIEKILTGEK